MPRSRRTSRSRPKRAKWPSSSRTNPDGGTAASGSRSALRLRDRDWAVDRAQRVEKLQLRALAVGLDVDVDDRRPDQVRAGRDEEDHTGVAEMLRKLVDRRRS